MSEVVHGNGLVAVTDRRNTEGRVWTDDKLGPCSENDAMI